VAELIHSFGSSTGEMPQKGNRKRRPARTGLAGSPRPAAVTVGKVTLSHPDRVYWEDAGVTKRDLAEFYNSIWKWMQPHVVGRPIALLRCPEGAGGQCFFQKHAFAGITTEHLHLVPEKGAKIISINDLDGLISLVQAGVLEIHTRGTTDDDRERADRLVFDLDPGPGTGWKDVVAAAHEVRERIDALKLKSFVKTSGGKGLHVVLPISPVPWSVAKDFSYAIAAAMAKDTPARYTATATKSKRDNRIFIDYLRNSREATAVAPYSTRARPGAPVSVPIDWSELGSLEREPIHRAQSPAAARAAAQGPVGQYRPLETSAAEIIRSWNTEPARALAWARGSHYSPSCPSGQSFAAERLALRWRAVLPARAGDRLVGRPSDRIPARAERDRSLDRHRADLRLQRYLAAGDQYRDHHRHFPDGVSDPEHPEPRHDGSSAQVVRTGVGDKGRAEQVRRDRGPHRRGVADAARRKPRAYRFHAAPSQSPQ